MTSTIPHVRKRDGVFQFERRVPLHIQRDAPRYAELFNSKPLYRVSLRTKDEGQALIVRTAAKAQFEALLAKAAGRDASALPELVLPAPPERIVTQADLDMVADRYAHLTADPFERLHRRANVDPAAAEELARMEYEIELFAEDIQRVLTMPHDQRDGPILRPTDEARLIVTERGYKAPAGSEDLGAIVGAVRTGMTRGYARISALSAGEAVPMLPPSNKPKPDSDGMTFAEAVKRYLEVCRPSSRAFSETSLALKQFEACVGRKALVAVSREDMHLFAEHLSNHIVGGKSAGSVVRHLSEQTIAKRIRMLGAVLNHAIDRGWMKGANPAHGIKVGKYVKETNQALMPSKRRLQVDELNRIFAHPWFTGCRSALEVHAPGNFRLDDSRFWAPIVALFTGCRAAELGGLKISDVRLNDRFPHFLIRDNEFRKVKNRRARSVPIITALLDLGFARYFDRISASGAVRLFPDWTARKRIGGGPDEYPAWSNANIIRSFNRTVLPTALHETLSADMRREVTFHSLRGAFKAMLTVTNGIRPHIANEVVGHANSELDERYIGGLTIEETYPTVHSCTYRGLILPPPPV